MRFVYVTLVFVLFFTSCGTLRIHKTSDFAPINDVKDLEGYYLNREGKISILSRFNIKEYADFITIASENSNEIKLIYYNDSTKREQVFEGQMMKNYFEIYFSNQKKVIPLIYSNYNIDRIRIGKTNNGNLLIRKFVDNSGHLLFFGGGYSVETPYKFLYASEYKNHIPMKKDGLWGYFDSLENDVVSAKYDFACIFEHGVARVKSNNKWGLINNQGIEITPLKYDKIVPIDTLLPPVFRVSIGEKTGVLDINGNESIPVIYDYMDNFPSCGFFRIRLNDKWGYTNRTNVVIPAIYSEASSFRYYYWNTMIQVKEYYWATVKRDEKYYVVDKDGYEYEAKEGIGFPKSPKLETKRKIQFEEQEIE